MSTTNDLRDDWLKCPCCETPAFAPLPATHLDGTPSPCGCPTWWAVHDPDEDKCEVAWDEDEQCTTCTRRDWCSGPESEAGRAFRGEGSMAFPASRREQKLRAEVVRLADELKTQRLTAVNLASSAARLLEAVTVARSWLALKEPIIARTVLSDAMDREDGEVPVARAPVLPDHAAAVHGCAGTGRDLVSDGDVVDDFGCDRWGDEAWDGLTINIHTRQLTLRHRWVDADGNEHDEELPVGPDDAPRCTADAAIPMGPSGPEPPEAV